jgi:hypothetical protein
MVHRPRPKAITLNGSRSSIFISEYAKTYGEIQLPAIIILLVHKKLLIQLISSTPTLICDAHIPFIALPGLGHGFRRCHSRDSRGGQGAGSVIADIAITTRQKIAHDVRK